MSDRDLLDDEETAILERLLARHDADGSNYWHLLEINATTASLRIPSGRRSSALSRLQGKGLLLSQHRDVEDERYAVHGIDPEMVRRLLAPPEPPGPRSRPSALSA